MKGVWRINKAKYASGEEYMLGIVRVGCWFNPTVSKGNQIVYRVSIELPGINMKKGTTDYDTADKAKKRLEQAVENWFKWIQE